jgi:hypothetical protein
MPFADKPVKSNILEDGRMCVGITGTGASNPTKNYGDGISVARQAAGVFRFSFLSHYGAYKGCSLNLLRGATPANLKQCTITTANPVAPSGNTPGYVDVQLWDSAGAARELAATEIMELEFCFAGMGG